MTVCSDCVSSVRARPAGGVQHKAVLSTKRCCRQDSMAVWPVQISVGQNNSRDQLQLLGSKRDSSLSALQQVSFARYPCL